MPKRTRSPQKEAERQTWRAKWRLRWQADVGSLRHLFCGLCVLSGEFVHLQSTVAELPLLVTLEGEPIAAQLVAADTTGVVTFRKSVAPKADAESPDPKPPSAEPETPNTEQSLPFAEFVRWGNPVLPGARIMVLLHDGGRLITSAAWAGGAAVRFEADTVVLLTDVFGEVTLPRAVVSGIVFAQRDHPEQREKLSEVVRRANRERDGRTESDLVLLANQDRVAANVTELAAGSLTLTSDAGTVKLPLSRVEAIAIGTDAAPSALSRQSSVISRQPLAVSHQPTALVGFQDGTLLHAMGAATSEQGVTLELANGVVLTGTTIGDLVYLQSLGGRFTYLSELEPAGYRHVPYLAIEWPYQRDRSVSGQPIAVRGRRYAKGIGMHSASRLTYRLDGQYRRFDAAVAIDDSAGKKGSVTFGVYVLRDGTWNEGYASGIVRGGEAPQPVSVDLTGAEGITLTVDYADRGDELDRAVWLDARVVAQASN